MEWSKKEIRKYYRTVLRYYLGNIIATLFPFFCIPLAILMIIDEAKGGWPSLGFLCFWFVGFTIRWRMLFVAMRDVGRRRLVSADVCISGFEKDSLNTVNQRNLWIFFPFPDIKYVLFAENGDKFLIKKKFGRKYSLKQFEYPINARIVYCRESKIVVSMIVDDKEFA